MDKFKLWKKDRPLSQNIVFTVAFIILSLYAAYVLFFLVYAVFIALRENMVTFTMDKLEKRLFLPPQKLKFSNFIKAFSELGRIDGTSTFLSLTWNSIWRTTLGAGLNIMSSAMVCYILVFYRCKLTKFIYNLGLILTMLPLYGTAAATFRLYTNLHLVNNPLIVITNITLYGTYFFYMIAYFKGLSWEYAEAAFMDGAGHFQVFFQVMLPMARSSIATLFIMLFISGWNEYESTLLYMNKYPNMSYAVYAYQEIGKYSANIPAYFAGILVSLVPVLILFLIFQNTIMEEVHLGGLKG